MQTTKFIKIELGDYHKPPIIKTNKRFPWLWCGKDNSYFEYLIACYQFSPTHSAIVNGKAKYIFGKGPEWIGPGKAKFDDAVKRLKLADKLRQVIRDFEIFNGYYIKPEYNPVSKTIKSFEHVPFRSIRTNPEIDCFYHSNNWTKEQSLEMYFKPNTRPTDLKEYQKFEEPAIFPQIHNFYHVDPGSKVYPLPPYGGGLAPIQTEIEINNFNLTSAKTMFSADMMIMVPDVPPDPGSEVQRQYDGMLKNKYTGSDNAGEVVLIFTGGKDMEWKFERFAPSNLPDLYENLLPQVTQHIFTAHEVTSPMLFGQKTEGQLGGRSELIDAYELFESNYISSRREEIQNDLTWLFNQMGIEGELTFPPQPPLGLTFGENTIVDVLRQNGGLNKAVGQYINDPDLAGKPDVQQINTEPVSPLEAALKKFDGIGEDAAKYTILAAVNCPKFDSDETAIEFEGRLSRLNFSHQKFAKLDDLQAELLGLLVADDNYKLSDLAERTGAKADTVIEALNRLQELNIIQYQTEGTEKDITVKRDIINKQETEEKTIIKYRYWGPVDNRNRDFCASLLKKGKLYTREELNNMKNQDGNSVWIHKGGWYHDPKTGVNRDNCRHIWQAVIVKPV